MQRLLHISSCFAFPAAVLLAHVVAMTSLHLYTFFPNADMPFHFIGGFSIAFACTQILANLEKERMIAILDRFVFLLLACALTTSVAVLWEFAEFGADRLLRTNVQVSLANTMQDQFLGICGGAAWALVYYLRQSPALTRR